VIKAKSIIILLASLVVFTVRAAERVDNGLLAFYDFNTIEGPIVKDRSGLKPSLDLHIRAQGNTRRTNGSLEIIKGTVITSERPPLRMLNALKQSNEITVEVWFKPGNLKQDGPARLVTISKNISERNFTIGQKAASLQSRLRTTRTSKNGMPAIDTTPILSEKLTHTVYVRDSSGNASLYVNGKKVKGQMTAGAMSNWDSSYRLALGNELSGERPWLGTLYLVAIYNRDLSAKEVALHFKSGSQAKMDPTKLAAAQNEHLFETKIAPLLSKHCLECHDPATAKDDLDLSQKSTAFTDKDMIVPGKHEISTLWEAVAKNEMPKKRTPLSTSEKALLKQWIDGGAKWTLSRIDPAIYAQGNETSGNWIRRLTVTEYIATILATTGVDISNNARALLPPELRADGFANTAYNLNIDLQHINAYAKLTELIVNRMDVTTYAKRFSRKQSFTDKDMSAFLEKIGRWILRGPLEKREVILYRGITTSVVANGGSYEEAIGLVLQAMLQSPRFIYRMENQHTGGRVGNFELAVRLSYLIWGAPPDEALYAAADQGKLSSPEQIRIQVNRMLKDPRAVDRSVQFLSQWLNLGHLANLRPDKNLFPRWNPSLAADMRAESIAFFKEIVWKQDRPLSDLFNAQFTYLTSQLAQHYGLTPLQNGNGTLRYDLTKIPSRGGLLTHGSVLTRGGDNASMVTRGLFVMHDLLRGVVKDPPPCVDTTPVPSLPGLSQRGIAEKRIANANCGGCHSKFEPLAFGLERFDGLGSYFEKDNHGNRLREDGQILFPGEAKPIAYRTSKELMNHLAGSNRVRQSITWKLSQFALGRSLGPRDARSMQIIHQAGWKSGGTYANLINAIAVSELFQIQPTENTE